MDFLTDIIPGLKKEEIRHFKLFAGRSHNQGQRKDFALFDLIRKQGGAYRESVKLEELQIPKEGAAFYRLRNRLLDELNKSLWIQHFAEDDESSDLYLYSLARLHARAERGEVAYHYLRRAERDALAHEHFKVLDLVYSLYIRLSGEMFTIDPQPYIHLRKENRRKMRALDEIDDILAALVYRIQVSLNYGEKDDDILRLLDETVQEYARDAELARSPRLRIKMYEAVSSVLLQREEYVALEKYLQETYASFVAEELFHRQTHDIQLRMLTYLVNTLQINRKYVESLEYAEKLRIAMLQFDGMLYDRYAVFYYNSLAVNYSVVDEEKAIELLLELQSNPSLQVKSFNRSFIFINLSALFFNTEKYRNALRSLIQLYLLDEYKQVDGSLKLRVEMLELASRFEMAENELLAGRILQLKRDYEDLLKQGGHTGDREFIEILSEMNQVAFEVGGKKRKQIGERMADFLKDTPKTIKDEQQPIFDYYDWLSVKLQAFS